MVLCTVRALHLGSTRRSDRNEITVYKGEDNGKVV